MYCFFFFFKQKTAYEMRISDWSSDVCSSDLTPTSSAGTALSRSGPRKRAVRWNEPSLLRTTPSPASATQGRKSAKRVEVRRYSARFIMVFLPAQTFKIGRASFRERVCQYV